MTDELIRWKLDYAVLAQELQRHKNWLHACDRKRKRLQTLCRNYDDGECTALCDESGDFYEACRTQCCVPGAKFDQDEKLIIPKRKK